jgi:L-ascorbate metabolism protein UlaG (beta-lactamase superfamily)
VDTLVWIGHATVCLELSGTRLLTDPVLRGRVGPLLRAGPVPAPSTYAEPDVVLISHLHHDHLDLASLRAIDKRVPVVAPAGAGPLIRRHGGHLDVREVAPGDSLVVGEVRITATSARHDPTRLASRASARPVGYHLSSDRHAVYFAGDTGPFPELAELAGQVDVALLPVGGWGFTLGPGHLDPRQAAEVTTLLRPALAVPVHWGTLFLPAGARRLRPGRSAQPGVLFAQWTRQLAPATEVIVPPPGAIVAMPWRTQGSPIVQL